ncbi:hypothetical protein [Bacillus infantis]|jgi:hypothetical protein|uniref:hypothetical protein n=1 Tax=Bacillus infantis TaxID=324767 RepID=UPI0021559DDD|nr:hypothetical protein [Bacillus infantis]MCR6610269.1 hypothetical protein [Bacillus infantis]
MSAFMTILLIIAAGILLTGLFYTMSVARNQRAVKGDMDSSISRQVQGHPYIRNPVILTYAICFILLVIFIAYYTTTVSW